VGHQSARRFSIYWITGGLILAAVAILLAARWRSSEHISAQPEILFYTDPMHPAYKSDKPGIAPDCGMDLVPVYAKDAGRSVIQAQPKLSTAVAISPESQRLYGISVATVETSLGEHVVRAFGRVTTDDTRIYRLNVSTAGFVKDTYGDSVGMQVRKDQKLATIYSSELIYAVAGYLAGNVRIPSSEMRDSARAPEAQNSQSRVDYLRNLGMSTAQIVELQETRKIPDNIYIESPVHGLIISRSASPGLRFEKNTELYTIADLSHVWVLADVFDNDVAAFRPGAEAQITLSSTGEIFRARVSTVLPEIDPATRNLRVRLELANPGLRLRPDMFVAVQLTEKLPAGLTVPAEAVLDAGIVKRVFVEDAQAHFEPREVETGWHVGNRVQILKGIKAGEVVAASGTFLVDSESRLEGAQALSTFPKQAEASQSSDVKKELQQ
jgi:Cu(I)/Ag(I) efflux system membrane fusion protein